MCGLVLHDQARNLQLYMRLLSNRTELVQDKEGES